MIASAGKEVVAQAGTVCPVTAVLRASDMSGHLPRCSWLTTVAVDSTRWPVCAVHALIAVFAWARRWLGGTACWGRTVSCHWQAKAGRTSPGS